MRSSKKKKTLANTTKLKIDIHQGTLDVEGSEHFVREIYNEFKERFDKNGRKSKEGQPKKKKNSERPKMVKDLDLKPQGKSSLLELYRSFKKLTRNEKFLLYVIYLQDHIGVTNITADHIYTCMKEVGDKVPATLKQILSNSKNKTGWFQIQNGKISYTQRGKTHYKEELRKKLKK